jgi:hypothetical protein
MEVGSIYSVGNVAYAYYRLIGLLSEKIYPVSAIKKFNALDLQ